MWDLLWFLMNNALWKWWYHSFKILPGNRCCLIYQSDTAGVEFFVFPCRAWCWTCSVISRDEIFQFLGWIQFFCSFCNNLQTYLYDLFTGEHKIILICEWQWLEIVEASFNVILMQFLNKLNLKNTIRYIRTDIQCTGQPKIEQTFSFLNGVLS